MGLFGFGCPASAEPHDIQLQILHRLIINITCCLTLSEIKEYNDKKFHLPPLMADLTYFCSVQNNFYVFFSSKNYYFIFPKNEATLQDKECCGEKAEQHFRKLGSFPYHHFFPGSKCNEVIELHVINKIGNLPNIWLSMCYDTLKMLIHPIFPGTAKMKWQLSFFWAVKRSPSVNPVYLVHWFLIFLIIQTPLTWHSNQCFHDCVFADLVNKEGSLSVFLK